MGDILGADDAVLAGVSHLFAAEAEELCLRIAGAKFGDDLGAVVVTTGFAGGEEDSRIGCRCNGTSVDFSRRDCMAGVAVKRFRAMLENLGGELGWTVARVPFDVKTAWKKMVRLRVKVEVAGEVFRTSLFVDSVHGGHVVLVNKKMQKAAGVGRGGMIDLAVEPDLEEREAWVPAELEKLLKEEKTLAKWYAKLSEPTRREIGKYIDGVKGAEARQRRSEQTAERLMLTMESEKELPPILEVAFRRAPAARKGWDAMTVTRRRGHLLGVFHYQSPGAREKRVGKLVEDCLRVGESSRR
ncbi:MAG TPA: YdeI/OmpD-associated family protein [Edaphobacter sp.]